MKKLSSNFRYCLVGRINGLADQVKKSRSYMMKCKTELSLNAAADIKRFLGNVARHQLLAYAFLNGTPYNKVERKCREDNKPNVQAILRNVLSHVYMYEEKKYTADIIKAWLLGEI